ncbi:hypothetical protein [Coprobacter tertius]|uniref:Uncharacterized protein n=1 Tax=Coprobacter tertius TaxID=2944915 RepID=A0ABT1MGA9_9BACT|nr:hypothetical protein [Coprobacter tertius]MCP9611674.1 hypothetical protein [Coprobacter tertius]
MTNYYSCYPEPSCHPKRIEGSPKQPEKGNVPEATDMRGCFANAQQDKNLRVG